MATLRCNRLLLLPTVIVFLAVAVEGETLRQRLFLKNVTIPCNLDQFQCFDGRCLDRIAFCNGINDCSDGSDENYCRTATCPVFRNFETYACGKQETRTSRSYYETVYRCIPKYWGCDGHRDCPQGEDESDCGNMKTNTGLAIQIAKKKAQSYLWSARKSGSPLRKWGSGVDRMTTALFLSNHSLFFNDTTSRHELASEITVEVLSRMALKTLNEVSSTELASYVHALLVTCVNPRDFFMVDLVAELRRRVEKSNHVSPYVMLALCNAGERTTTADVERLTKAFFKANDQQWTDTQALIVLALSCAATQEPSPAVDLQEVQLLSMELKKRQYRNGTVENLKTTALVLQAILSSDPESDEDNFDEEKSLRRIMEAQSVDGSFENFANAYYVLPVLAGNSLANVSAKHCNYTRKDGKKYENEAYRDLLNQVGNTWRVKFSLWFGDNRTVERTLSLRIPANTSLYGGMEYAADIDNRYRFEYTIRNGKPYVYSISGTQDDPENQIFWHLWTFRNNSNQTMVQETKSPADIVPQDEQHFVYWYKHRHWTTEEQ